MSRKSLRPPLKPVKIPLILIKFTGFKSGWRDIPHRRMKRFSTRSRFLNKLSVQHIAGRFFAVYPQEEAVPVVRAARRPPMAIPPRYKTALMPNSSGMLSPIKRSDPSIGPAAMPR